MRGAFLAALISLPLVAAAQAVPGEGRVAALAGMRFTPNDHFRRAAASAGYPPGPPSPGGLQLQGAFSYAATAHVDACIDLFGGWEQLRFAGGEKLQSVTYGAHLGTRIAGPTLFGALTPHLGLHAGPTFVLVSSEELAGGESFGTGFAVSAGLSWRIDPRWGLAAEYKLLFARGLVPEIATLNGGGHWVSLGPVFYFPSEGPSGFSRPGQAASGLPRAPIVR